MIAGASFVEFPITLSYKKVSKLFLANDRIKTMGIEFACTIACQIYIIRLDICFPFSGKTIYFLFNLKLREKIKEQG